MIAGWQVAVGIAYVQAGPAIAMTTPEDFQLIRAWVHELIDLDPPARSARLALLRAEHGAIVAQVEALLERIEPADLAPAAAAATAASIGRRIGPFELVARIGVGGMGMVYDARRVDGSVEQRVAIKLPGRSVLSPGEQRRLRRERDLLARLEHPNIARLVDAGNEAGVGPWFAMEFVDGESITRHADAQRMDVRARLRLWLQLAAAVVYAHQHLIVHRDLKPANVLVDRGGRVKLLDFGVANLYRIDSDSANSLPAFTPNYASPEQIAGEPVTTATDVHGLGLVLFELLCGMRAFAERSDLALRQAIATSDAPTLRAAVARLDAAALLEACAARSSTLAQWRGEIGGELEAIVAKALRKLPRERYASAIAFADDVTRYLAGEQIEAMPPTMGYRMSKFAARHRLALGALAAVLVSLAVGLIATTLQRDRARLAETAARSAETQLRAENGLLADVLGGGPDYVRGGPDTPVRELLRSSADMIAAREGLAPLSRANLLHTLAEGQLALLDDAAADSVLARAEDALRQAPDGMPLLLRIKLKRSWIRFEGEAQEAALRETADLWPQIESVGGAVLLEALQNRAHFHAIRRDFALGLADLDAAAALAATMLPLPQRDLSQIRYNRIQALMNLQRNQEAYRLALEHLAAADAQPKEFISARISATDMFARAASKLGYTAAARERLAAVLPLAESLHEGRGNRLASVVGALAGANRLSGRLREAARLHQRQAQLRQQTTPGSVYVASALRFAGIALRGVGDSVLAEDALRRARALFDKLGAASEVAHCDLHLLAVRAQAQPGRASFAALGAGVDRMLRDGEPSDRIEALGLAIEAALRTGDLDAAGSRLQQLQAAATQQQLGGSEIAAVDVFAAEVAVASGDASALAGLAASMQSSDNVALQARLADLAVQVAAPGARERRCGEAEAAWRRVDDEGRAWLARSAGLGCTAYAQPD